MKYPNPKPDESMQVSSSSDCTGLIPAGTTDEEELLEYSQLYDFLPTAVKTDQKPRS